MLPGEIAWRHPNVARRDVDVPRHSAVYFDMVRITISVFNIATVFIEAK